MSNQVLNAPAPTEATAPTQALSKADVQLWVHFDLGAVYLSLPEIEQLAPGHTLLLSRDPNLPVQLKCCGQTIAAARLIQVNGQLAIQVATLQPLCKGDQT